MPVMRITVFANTVSTQSIDRYTRELAANFPSNVEAKAVYFHPSSTGVQKQIDRYWGYLKLARQEQGDYNVIVSEGCAYLLMVLPKERTICVCHDVHPLLYSGPRNLHHRFYDLRYRTSLHFLPKAKYIVSVSEATRRELLRCCPFIPEDKVIAVHNGIEEWWRPVAGSRAVDDFRRRHDLERHRIVLHVGEDVFYKNVHTVIRAFAQLPQPDLLLVKVGSLTKECQNLIDNLGVRGRVRHLPRVSDEDLLMLYNAAAVFVFPSISEGFGWPPLEAMACGCPVIASNCASLPEVCGDACLYVKATDASEIVAAINRILTDESCGDSLRKKGLSQASNYSWKKTSAEFLRLFQ